jgi:hypothetical protein
LKDRHFTHRAIELGLWDSECNGLISPVIASSAMESNFHSLLSPIVIYRSLFCEPLLRLSVPVDQNPRMY